MERGFLQTAIDYVSLLIPAKGEAYLMIASGAVGSALAWALGGIDLQLQWLMVFVIVDYVTGTIAAGKTGEWNSRVGFRGLFKKVFIFVVVMLSHGLDVIAGTDMMLRNAAIAAYAVNEGLSIIENIDRLGYGNMVPQFLKNAMLQFKKEKEASLNERFKR